MCAKTLAFVFAFLLPILLVRQMSQSEFGLYKQAFLVVNTAVTILPLGFAMSAFYFLPRAAGRKGHVIFNVLLFYLFIAVVVYGVLGFYPNALAAIFNARDLVAYGPEIGAVAALWIVSSFLEFVAVANGEARLAAFFIVTFQFSRSLSLLAAAILFTSLRALIYAALVQGVFQAAVSISYLSRRFPGFWLCFDWRTLRSQLAYALPLGVAGLLYYIQMDAHHYIVANRFGAAAYAIYAIGCFQLPFLSILAESAGAIMIERVSYLQSQNNKREILFLTARMLRKLGAIYFPVFALFLVLGREFITVIFTELYLDSWPIFAINLVLIPLGMIASAYDPVLRAYPEYLSFLIRVRTALLGLLLIVLWLATEHFRLVGAISAVVAVNIIERAIIAFRVGRIMGISSRDLVLFKDLGKLGGAAAVAALAAAAFRGLMPQAHPLALLAACGAAFAIVYFGLVFLWGVLEPGERSVIRGVAERLGVPVVVEKALTRWF